MEIYVRAFANLADEINLDQGRGHVEMDDGSTVGDLLNALKMPETSHRIVLVNGLAASENQKLKHGDKVTLFPPVEGG